jgi:hypothetical protein
METTIVDADPTVGATAISKELDKVQKEQMKNSTSIMALSEYDFLSMAFNGDKNFRDGTLVRTHDREDALSYKGRREMAFLKNFLKPVVNARVDPVFSEAIVREFQDEAGKQAQPALAMAFLEDCDNCKTTFGQFMEDAAREGNLQSLTFLIVDSFADAAPLVADNVKARRFPYVYRQNRDTLKDYSVDRYGSLQWIRFFDHTEKSPDGKEVNYYRYWDAQTSKLQKEQKTGKEIKYVDVETVNHGLGFVPVYPMAFLSKRKKDCLSIDYEFYDLARCNWTIYNLDSATMEAIFDQCFSLLCIQGVKSENVLIGTKSVCWVSPEVSNMPIYISPDPATAKIASDYADKIKLEIYEIAEQNGVTAVRKNGGVTEQSGKAKEWDFQAHGFILKKISGICSRAEQWVMDTFKLYTGEQFVYIPHYKQDFAIRDSDVLIAVQERVIDNNIGPKAVVLAKKNIARVAFVHNEPDEVKAVMEEIDTMGEDAAIAEQAAREAAAEAALNPPPAPPVPPVPGQEDGDRKSTRLNSSHLRTRG